MSFTLCINFQLYPLIYIVITTFTFILLLLRTSRVVSIIIIVIIILIITIICHQNSPRNFLTFKAYKVMIKSSASMFARFKSTLAA